MHRIIYLFIPLMFLSCKTDAELAIERGIKLIGKYLKEKYL